MSTAGIPFYLTIWKDIKNAGHQTGDGKTPIPYKINSITDRYSAITHYVGKQYEAEKMSKGGDRKSELAKSNLQSEDLKKDNRTVTRIAKEHGVSRRFVQRAEKFAKGLDAASILCIRIDRA